MITVLGHASRTNGNIYEAPVNTVTEILEKESKDFNFVRNFFTIDDTEIYENKNLVETIKVGPSHNLIRYFKHIKINISHLKKQNKTNVIAANPLNALSAILTKKINPNAINKIIFYSADYSKTRFGQPFLDNLYINLDRFCSKNADQTWSVSKRIYDIRKADGISDDKNIFLPNVPSISPQNRESYSLKRIRLVTLGMIDKQLDFKVIFEAIKNLKNDFDIVLNVVGSGPKLEEYKNDAVEMGVGNNIIFHGHKPHDEALEIIKNSDVGLALYNGKWSFNYYGDSMKCREYMCFGLPIITTDTHSTVEDIKETKSGEIVELNGRSIETGIRKIVDNYKDYSKNSFELGQKYSGIHKKMIDQL